MELTNYKGTGTLHNPTLLAEVSSPATRQYDLGEKLARYQSIEALEHVVLVDIEAAEVRLVSRAGSRWEAVVLTRPDALGVLGVAVPLAELLDGLPDADAA
jgi:Uma2 family endonuclease